MCAKQKSPVKHTEKKSVAPSVDLFPSVAGAKALTDHVTAAQLFPHTGLDDAALRRRARELAPDGRPWIPAPRGSKWPLTPLLLGLIRYLRHALETADRRALPRQCASMKDLEATYHIPVDMQKHLREQGLCPEAFKDSSRVEILPLLAASKPFLKKIFSPDGAKLAGLAGFEQLDKDTMQARVAAQVEIEKIRENALATQQLQTREGIEKILGEPLAAVAASWKNYEKNTGGKIKTLLTGAGVPPEIITQTIRLAVAGIHDPMDKLRAALPSTEETNLDKAA